MVLQNSEFILRLVLAALFGSVIGLERERLAWAAGLRTHMLVCVGSCLFMIVSAWGFVDVIGYEHVSLDPSRVAAGVVSGIGFLGAGTILLRREVIRGLTTAASLWTVAAIGLATGGGLYIAAISATLIVYAILAWLKPIERRFLRKGRTSAIVLKVRRTEHTLASLDGMFAGTTVRVQEMVIKRGDADEDEIHLLVSTTPSTDLATLTDQLRQQAGVIGVELKPD
ncbi:MgtC/SapB family protein [soil metagenome]